MEKKFTIAITTKNRLAELAYTLEKIAPLLQRPDTLCMICDDGSSDGTSAFVNAHYPDVLLLRNEKSRGYIYNRNLMMAQVKTPFALSLDDDLHLLSDNPLEQIESAFMAHPDAAVLGFRIFWGKEPPRAITTAHCSKRMRSFVGCAHAWNMRAWRDAGPYPEWFVFYGEEDFAAFSLYKKGWQVRYLPEVLGHHRVEVKARKKDRDYGLRLRRSLRAGWCLFALFYPPRPFARAIAYSIFTQFKMKVLKGDRRAFLALVLAGVDFVWFLPRLIVGRNALSNTQYKAFQKLPDTEIYWKVGQ